MSQLAGISEGAFHRKHFLRPRRALAAAAKQKAAVITHRKYSRGITISKKLVGGTVKAAKPTSAQLISAP